MPRVKDIKYKMIGPIGEPDEFTDKVSVRIANGRISVIINGLKQEIELKPGEEFDSTYRRAEKAMLAALKTVGEYRLPVVRINFNSKTFSGFGFKKDTMSDEEVREWQKKQEKDIANSAYTLLEKRLRAALARLN